LTLTNEARDAIAHAVARLRVLFEDEFSAQASGRFGFHILPSSARAAAARAAGPSPGDTDGEQLINPWIEPLSALSLSPSQRSQRAELIGALAYLRREGVAVGEAVARIIREAAFTAVNRLLAVRVGEAVGIFPEVTLNGRQSSSYRDVVQDLFPLLSQEEDEGYWKFLQTAGDELGATVPQLFDRRLPTSAFVPSRSCVDRALEVLNGPDVVNVWAEPEALGWAYQFFNGDDVQQMRDASPDAPRNSRELAVRNQFFTPRYVVDWLVQNTLGRQLRRGGSAVELPLLVGAPGEPMSIDLDEIKILDPACGSGHFLLGCYDLLEDAWSEQGVSSADAAPRILRSLFGIEIDPRASQVAQAVLVLRAGRSAPNTMLNPPTIVTARPLPGAAELRRRAFSTLSLNAQDLAESLDAALASAPTLGSLLKVEEHLASALRRTLKEPKLAADARKDQIEAELLQIFEDVARQDASPAALLFGADASDAVRFVSLCEQRYDVVLMNPPFGRPVPETGEYLRTVYGKAAADLYASFVMRGMGLLAPEGILGAITSRTGFFQSTLEEWRCTITPHLQAFLDLGLGVMKDAMVESAAYVLGRRPTRGECTFRRLTDMPDKADALYRGSGELFHVAPSHFNALPTSPLAYWADPELIRCFSDFPRLEPKVELRQGLVTGDAFQFVRLWWEVSPERVGPDKKWVHYVKGGEFSPFFTDVHLVVDWSRKGDALRERVNPASGKPYSNIWMLKGTISRYFFRPGLTWPVRARALCLQVLPADAIFSVRSQGLFDPKDSKETLSRLLAWANGGLTDQLAKLSVGRSDHPEFVLGVLKNLPAPALSSTLGEQAGQGYELVSSLWAQREESILFESPFGPSTAQNVSRSLSELQERVDGAVSDAYRKSSVAPYRRELPGEFLKSPIAGRIISFLVGCAFGRWKATSLDAVGRMFADAWEPMPARSPAMDSLCGSPYLLRGGRGPGSLRDAILEGVLGDANDSRLEAALEADLRAVKAPDLETYLAGRYFKDHLHLYSKSSRKAPIYWKLGVPSGAWHVWLYYPRLCREALFAVVSAAQEEGRRAVKLLEQFQRATEFDRDTQTRIEALEVLSQEMAEFERCASDIAQCGWEPDLDDGVVLNSAPLEAMISDDTWRREILKEKEKLQSGGYPWSTVQRYYFRAS
jgi:hypothetical protein